MRVEPEREHANGGVGTEHALQRVGIGRELRPIALHLPEQVERREVVPISRDRVDGGVPRHEQPIRVRDTAEDGKCSVRAAAGGVEVDEGVGDDDGVVVWARRREEPELGG